ncbi:glycosyltransferase family A protein [Sphingomonas sp. ASV193]|uniref:glycosyltransferase family 2 protein n=1 Tax=Sphingomonas sp. ASV193 TaxID=3144405 RepID=UPI0032E8EE6F
MTAAPFRVAVVMPLFDKAEYAAEAIDSVLAQTLAPLDVVIVDDGSTDGGPEAVERRFGEQVRLLRQPNAGPGPARNRGVAATDADWIAFIDADDKWSRDHLATLAEVAYAFPDADLIATGHRRFCGGQTLTTDRSPVAARKINYFQEARVGEPVWTSACAVRRSAFEAIGGFGAFCPGEDVDLWVSLALKGDVARSDRVTAHYRQDTGGEMDQLGCRPVDKQEQPVFDRFATALADPGLADRHAAIRALRDQWRRNAIRQRLVAGDREGARRLIALAARRGTATGRSEQVLALLPGRMTGAILALRGALRRGPH